MAWSTASPSNSGSVHIGRSAGPDTFVLADESLETKEPDPVRATAANTAGKKTVTKKYRLYISSDHVPPWHNRSKPYFRAWKLKPLKGYKIVSYEISRPWTKNGVAFIGDSWEEDGAIKVHLAVKARGGFLGTGRRNWIGVDVFIKQRKT